MCVPGTASSESTSRNLILQRRFASLQSDDDGSGTEYAPSTDDAWNLDTHDGNRNNDDGNDGLYAVAVRSGG